MAERSALDLAMASRLAWRRHAERFRIALEQIANGGNAVMCDWANDGPKTRDQMAAIAISALTSHDEQRGSND
jgi:hypothetical protein